MRQWLCHDVSDLIFGRNEVNLDKFLLDRRLLGILILILLDIKIVVDPLRIIFFYLMEELSLEKVLNIH